MKKYLFLLLVPLLALPTLIFFIIVFDETNGFKSREVLIGIDDHCDGNRNYVLCAFSNVKLLEDFAVANAREPEPNEIVKSDDGGCDMDFLGGFKWNNEAQDYRLRVRFKEACTNWYAIHAAEILLGKGYAESDAGKLNDFPPTLQINEENVQKFKDFMRIGGKGPKYKGALYDYCRNNSNLGESYMYLLMCTPQQLPETTRFSFETMAFSYGALFIAMSPLLILIGFIYFILNKYPSMLSSETVSWMNNRKQFRIFLVVSIAWTLAFFTYSMVENNTINPFDDDDAWLPVILGLYPLLTFLITYFIVSAEDEKNNEST